MAQWDEHDPSDVPGSPASRGNGSAITSDDTEAQMQALFDNARAELDRYVSSAADFIRARPVACVAGAIAIGFLVGKFASRK